MTAKRVLLLLVAAPALGGLFVLFLPFVGFAVLAGHLAGKLAVAGGHLVEKLERAAGL